MRRRFSLSACATLAGRRRPGRPTRASVLIIVLVTLVFAAFALVTFMDKATNDLLVDYRDARDRRLRIEAYSALETTLAVLVDFQEANNGLHSPAEGWSDPLGFAGYTPAEGHTIDVAFEDESGKISLPHADAPTLSRLFQSWGVSQMDADGLADALLGWMKRDHVYTTPLAPDYETSAIPYEPPGRSLRSYTELAAIDDVRDFFFDRNGQPNAYYNQFIASVSLFDFAKTNINGAAPGALAAVGQYNENELQNIRDYLNGSGMYQNRGAGFFKDPTQAQAIAGAGGNAGAFGTAITALRIIITVHEGKSLFRLAAVVTGPNGGAKIVQENATTQKTERTAEGASKPEPKQKTDDATREKSGSNNGAVSGTTADLKYPFKLLEIRENDEIPPAPVETSPFP